MKIAAQQHYETDKTTADLRVILDNWQSRVVQMLSGYHPGGDKRLKITMMMEASDE